MKFDVVRAWKDENYRQGLTEEQLSTLPVNPAGELELTDAELESVYGGHSWSHSHVTVTRENFHSYALICDINVFSVNLPVLPILNIGNSNTVVCVNAD